MNVNDIIREQIGGSFPSLKVFIYPDKTEDNVIVAIDDDLYYSDEYLSLVMQIKIDILWKNNIFNYLFIKEKSNNLSILDKSGNSFNQVLLAK